MKVLKSVLVFAFSGLMLAGCGNKEEKKKEGFSYEKTKTETVKQVNQEASKIDETEVQKLLTKNTCVACHSADKKLIGPSFKDIAKRNYSDERIVELIYKPEPGNWPEYSVPMAPLPNVPKNEALKIASWINSLN